MELVEKIVVNPVTLGATAVAIGTAADAITQSSTASEDRKTCVLRLVAWSGELEREHKHLCTAMLTDEGKQQLRDAVKGKTITLQL